MVKKTKRKKWIILFRLNSAHPCQIPEINLLYLLSSPSLTSVSKEAGIFVPQTNGYQPKGQLPKLQHNGNKCVLHTRYYITFYYILFYITILY